MNLSTPVAAFAMFLAGVGGFPGEYSGLRMVVIATLAVTAGLYLTAALLEGVSRRIANVFVSTAVMALLTGVSLVVATEKSRLSWPPLVSVLSQCALIAMLIGYSFQLPWNRPWFWKLLCAAGIGVLGANAVLWIRSGFVMPFAGLATAKNGLATASAMGLAVSTGTWTCRSGVASVYLAAACGLLSAKMLIASSGRSTMIAVGLALLVALNWRRIARTRLRMSALFAGSALISLASPAIYMHLSDIAFFRVVDVESTRFLGIRLYTGRETLWPKVLDGIAERPWYGHGTHATMRFERRLRNGEVQTHSAHNLYLATLYQSGVAGLLGLAFFLWTVWMMYFPVRDTSAARLGAAFFIGVLFRENFTVSLTQNNLQVGIGLWCFGASGFARCFRPTVVSAGHGYAHQAEQDSVEDGGGSGSLEPVGKKETS